MPKPTDRGKKRKPEGDTVWLKSRQQKQKSQKHEREKHLKRRGQGHLGGGEENRTHTSLKRHSTAGKKRREKRTGAEAPRLRRNLGQAREITQSAFKLLGEEEREQKLREAGRWEGGDLFQLSFNRHRG